MLTDAGLQVEPAGRSPNEPRVPRGPIVPAPSRPPSTIVQRDQAVDVYFNPVQAPPFALDDMAGKTQRGSRCACLQGQGLVLDEVVTEDNPDCRSRHRHPHRAGRRHDGAAGRRRSTLVVSAGCQRGQRPAGRRPVAGRRAARCSTSDAVRVRGHRRAPRPAPTCRPASPSAPTRAAGELVAKGSADHAVRVERPGSR